MKKVHIKATVSPVGKRHIRIKTSVTAGNKRTTKTKLVHI